MTDQLYQAVDAYILQRLDHTIDQLARLCAQPSISAQNIGIAACADLTASLLEAYGFQARVLPTAGHPAVYGEGAGRHAKTMLLYLHYDVQPPEPLELWDSPPFELTRRDNRLIARGVSDDKGHIIARLAALEAWRAVLGELPCHIKWIIEGEEEIGSPSIDRFVHENRDLLAADGCIWEFGSVNHQGAPLLALGVRGICYVELTVQTASQDAHSGLGGSIFPNAAWRLTWALNSLKDRNERILLPNYYDTVLPPTERDLALLAALPDEAAVWLEMYQLPGFLNGLQGGLELRRRAVLEPTCTICGLEAGYQGPGTKTIIPSRARAKVDFRLVPNQTPETVLQQLRAHLDAQGFNDIHIQFMGGYPPCKIDPDDPLVQLTRQAALDVYQQEPVIEPIIGGSGPMASFVQHLQLPIVSAGVGYPNGRVHAPNENVRIDDLVRGIQHTARIIGRFAGL